MVFLYLFRWIISKSNLVMITMVRIRWLRMRSGDLRTGLFKLLRLIWLTERSRMLSWWGSWKIRRSCSESWFAKRFKKGLHRDKLLNSPWPKTWLRSNPGLRNKNRLTNRAYKQFTRTSLLNTKKCKANFKKSGIRLLKTKTNSTRCWGIFSKRLRKSSDETGSEGNKCKKPFWLWFKKFVIRQSKQPKFEYRILIND